MSRYDIMIQTNTPRPTIPPAAPTVIAGDLMTAGSRARTTQRETTMYVHRNGSDPTTRAPEAAFTGDVQISGYFQREAPSQLAGAAASFPPGTRTPWKVNPLGQTLVVASGVGWAQCEGEAIVEVRAGDLIWCPPGERHWEGATPDHAMTYLAMHEGTVEFRDKVSDEEYREGPPATAGI